MEVSICGFHQRPLTNLDTKQCDLCIATQVLEEEGYRVSPSPAAQVERERERRKVWLQAWTATANASNSTSIDVCHRYAEACLEKFDKLFPEPI